ncbi:alcohol dehydrogenase [Blastococcus sp. MG754426]|uniref:alcohol dehydrogenase catalytic domain-containing protein n=1 Tax=unclassified Blastococcus TaxID=2619396 RepID=UPI001EEFBA63|nr:MULTISPECIES: alcohol dehydrogenase catalytic domain-containing protein [unclassified Blastococcus]MCF6507301.1 alcohol dehydrogenase [Blastococcus sp. MG754426]MCF6510787.1 alcohol dehydrogenase [Blastococcus sp. MG754427]MCF6734351.1 alcohol dehydrogenase [Blastococcus sp. KM273129]
MLALVYYGPGKRSWEEVADPRIEDPEDAVVRVDAFTICGTDLHILRGDVPEVASGRVLGHEAVGTVQEVGPGVRTVRPGDRVLVSCITACGRCRFCREARYGQCQGGGGWILGHTVDGVQAEAVRVPFADGSVHRLPDDVSDEAALMLADIFPTSYEVGALNGGVRPGDTVVIVGAGPIGLAAVMTAGLYSPERIVVVDPVASRRAAATAFGADLALSPDDAVAETVRGLTGGLGADVTVEAVGLPGTFDMAVELVRPGGRVANVGVHGRPTTLHLEDLWIRDVTITTGLVDTSSTPMLLRMLRAGRLDAGRMVTHRFGFDEVPRAYDVFDDPVASEALKVSISRR